MKRLLSTLVFLILLVILLQKTNGNSLSKVRKLQASTDVWITRSNSHVGSTDKQRGCLDRFCRKCKPDWYLVIANVRKCSRNCPPGHYIAAGHCIKCPWGCKKCHRPSSCDMCSRGLIILQSSSGTGDYCVFACPRGHTKKYTDIGYICYQECLVSHCINCESFSESLKHCDLCKRGYHKITIDTNDACVKSCPAGYHRVEGEHGGSVCRNDSLIDVHSTRDTRNKEILSSHFH